TGIDWSDLGTVEVSSDDPLKVYTGFLFSNGIKVMRSTNGGNNWSDLSTGLPTDCDIRVLSSEKGSKNIYAGTSKGIYYYNDDNGQWLSYMNNLPNVFVADFSFNYSTNEIFAGTHGRGAW